MFGLNHVKGSNDLKYIIEKGKKGGNIGTLKRLVINQSCSSGQVYISATPLNAWYILFSWFFITNSFSNKSQ